MRKFIVVGGFLVLTSFCLGGPAYSAPKAASRGAALTMSVTQEASEEVRIADIAESYTPLARYSSAAAGTEIQIGYSRDMNAELRRTRTSSAAILVGPAHTIGSPPRYGHEPLRTFPGSE